MDALTMLLFTDIKSVMMLKNTPTGNIICKLHYIQCSSVLKFVINFFIPNSYILIVSRSSSPDPASLFRSYKEFCELHQKICLQYPLTRLHR